MYTYFEDWSAPILLESLDRKGLPHGDRIIKVFTSIEDPRRALGKQSLQTVINSGRTFDKDEVYEYGDRGVHAGAELELALAAYGLSDIGDRTVRALFRFSNEHGFCQAAMQATAKDGWLIDHPFGDIDGLEAASRHPAREQNIHLDVFFPDSLEALRAAVDYDNPALLLGMREGMQWRRGQMEHDGLL